MAWPEAGGGGDLDLELNEEELFERLCAWDDHNYIIGAGTVRTPAMILKAAIVALFYGFSQQPLEVRVSHLLPKLLCHWLRGPVLTEGWLRHELNRWDS